MLNSANVNAILEVLGKDSLTATELKHIKINWLDFYTNPYAYIGSVVVDMVNQSLSEIEIDDIVIDINDTDTDDSRLQTELIDALSDIVSVIHDLSCLWTEDRISKYGTEWKNIRYLLTNVLESYYNWDSDGTILADIMDIQTGEIYEIKRSVNIMKLRNLAKDRIIAVPYARN